MPIHRAINVTLGDHLRSVAIAVLLILVAGLGGSAIAQSRTSQIRGKGAAISGVSVVSDTSTFSISCCVFVDLPGATVRLNVPSGGAALLLVKFSGYCTYAAGYARVLVDGIETNPVGDDDFCSGYNPNFEPTPASTILRWSDQLGAGQHTVQVQVSNYGGTGDFSIKNWILIVEHARTAP